VGLAQTNSTLSWKSVGFSDSCSEPQKPAFCQECRPKFISIAEKACYRAGRGADGRFFRKPERAGPRGSRNRATLLTEDLLDGRARVLTEKDEVDLQMLEGTNPQILADEQMGCPQPTA